MAYYQEIVRVANVWPEMEEWEKVDRLVESGALCLALELLCRFCRRHGDTSVPSEPKWRYPKPTDPSRQNDIVLYESSGRYLCRSLTNWGYYDAFYVTEKVDE